MNREITKENKARVLISGLKVEVEYTEKKKGLGTEGEEG